MAATPQSQPARSRRRCRDFGAAPEFRGNRPRRAVARHGAEAGGRLNVPLRERNVLLVAAGYAPAFPQRSLDDPALKSAREAIDLVLRAHEPSIPGRPPGSAGEAV